MFEFLFKKQFKKLNQLDADLYALRTRVIDLEKQYHELHNSIEQDKKVDRHLHELNSDEIKNITQKIDELEKLIQNVNDLTHTNVITEPKKTRKPRAKKTKEIVNE